MGLVWINYPLAKEIIDTYQLNWQCSSVQVLWFQNKCSSGYKSRFIVIAMCEEWITRVMKQLRQVTRLTFKVNASWSVDVHENFFHFIEDITGNGNRSILWFLENSKNVPISYYPEQYHWSNMTNLCVHALLLVDRITGPKQTAAYFLSGIPSDEDFF